MISNPLKLIPRTMNNLFHVDIAYSQVHENGSKHLPALFKKYKNVLCREVYRIVYVACFVLQIF